MGAGLVSVLKGLLVCKGQPPRLSSRTLLGYGQDFTLICEEIPLLIFGDHVPGPKSPPLNPHRHRSPIGNSLELSHRSPPGACGSVAALAELLPIRRPDRDSLCSRSQIRARPQCNRLKSHPPLPTVRDCGSKLPAKGPARSPRAPILAINHPAQHALHRIQRRGTDRPGHS